MPVDDKKSFLSLIACSFQRMQRHRVGLFHVCIEGLLVAEPYQRCDPILPIAGQQSMLLLRVGAALGQG